MVGRFAVPALRQLLQQSGGDNKNNNKESTSSEVLMSCDLEALENLTWVLPPIPRVILEAPSSSSSSSGGGRGGRQRGGPGNNHQKLPVRVLELGCGRGGDLRKWSVPSLQLDLYVGVDVAAVALEEARRRTGHNGGRGGKGGSGNGRRGGKSAGGKGEAGNSSGDGTASSSSPEGNRHGFLLGDMSEPDLGARIDAEARRLLGLGALLPSPPAAAAAPGSAASSSPVLFDAVAIQFALHYCCGQVCTRSADEHPACLLKYGYNHR